MASNIDENLKQRAIAVLRRHRLQLLREPGVAAVDVGFPMVDGRPQRDQIALRIHVERKLPPEQLPESSIYNRSGGEREVLDGVPVDIVEATYGATSAAPSAPVPPDSSDLDYTAPFLTLMGGMSVGNPRVSAGTLGAIVWDRRDGSPNILSNWHVLAGSTASTSAASGVSGAEPHYHALTGPEPHYHDLAGPEPHYHDLAGPEPHYHSASDGAPHLQAAYVGEPILQPARFDGGTPRRHTVARLSRRRLDRHMDAAIARLTGARAYSSAVLGMSAPLAGVADAELGMVVTKSGRSTKVTTGLVDGISLSTIITYEHGEQRFDDQIHIVPLAPPTDDAAPQTSEPGDSGAVWIDTTTNNAVGLHFGGDLTGNGESEHSLANPMPQVAEALEISVTPLATYLPRPCPCCSRPSRTTGLAEQVLALSRTALGGRDAGPGRARAELELLRGVIDAALSRD